MGVVVEVEDARLQRRCLRQDLPMKELGQIAGIDPDVIGRLEKAVD